MDPIVAVSGGKVRGRTVDGVSAFLGIPYAAAPVGAARFLAPTAAPEWDGIRDAFEIGPTCTQSPYPPAIAALLGTFITPGDETLSVNVWTPDPGGSGLPVMVWIHGGAFTRGSNSIPIYNGATFARDGVVLVAINYRLGVPGFCAVESGATNRGLRDQLFALAWVQDNIRAFGGDPANVTIFGESAGGMSVAALLASPAAAGLFTRAIMQSGNATTAADIDDARRVAEAVAAKLGIASTATDFGAVDPDVLLAAQDAVSLDLVMDPNPDRWGSSIIRQGLGVMNLFPIIDGDIIPEVPLDAITKGAGRNVAVIAGTTTDEFRFFTVTAGIAAAITPEALVSVLSRHGWDASVGDAYAATRPSATPGDLLATILTDHAFRDGTMALADAHTAAGGASYVYEFAWPTPVEDLRACHALELPFVFDNLADAHALAGPTPPQRLATEMHSAWVGFARDGDPGWPRFEAAGRPVQTFDEPTSTVVNNPRADELAALRA